MNAILPCLVIVTMTQALLATDNPIPPTSLDPKVEQRVDALLKQMTLEEKIDMLGGHDNVRTEANPRLGIPSLRMSDGPVGVHNWGPATMFPASICGAATWDVDLMRRVGQAFGREARARGVHVILAPALNIHRVSRCGRNFEYLGEDPFLASAVCVPFVQGAQGEGVIATVKHFAANNQEDDRHGVSATMDERTLHEIYLPAFKAAVQQGHVWAVMSAYNRINDVYCSENEHLLCDILKGEWGFNGFVMSDWGATHDGVNSAKHCLDLEMPSGAYMNRDTLLPAIKKGDVSETVIDDKIRRMLRAFVTMGFLDREQKLDELPVYSPDSRRVALEEARKGIVLLRNRESLLPLDRGKVRSIAVLGPNAHPGVPAGGGSSYTEPFRGISVLEGLVALAGERTDIHFALWQDDPTTLFVESRFVSSAADPKAPTGLKGEYFNNATLDGEPSFTRVDEHINLDWTSQSPFCGPDAQRDHFSVRWTGAIPVSDDGDYQFLCRHDDGVRLYVNDELVIDNWKDQAPAPPPTVNSTGRATLKRGLSKIRLEYYQGGGGAEVRFGWRPQPPDPVKTAAALAAKADVAVVCVGFNQDSETEGRDRTFELPPGQDDLIESVAKANPNTIVIVNAGGAVAMTRWIDQIGALLYAWYPGQEGGQAIAELLFGDQCPSGKLPASFERRWEDAAASGDYPGRDHVCNYREGIFVGYRHFDRTEVRPLFPFGFGLSYTLFAYGDLKLDRAGAGDDAAVKVSFKIRNAGQRRGAEIAQVYVQDVECSLPRPVKELKGFARVELDPRESRNVSVTLDRSSFAFYDADKHSWTVEPGEFRILVGDSSQEIKLQAVLRYP
ncbi:MAG TPA: glycoside hydrolase family 3 C-terminal domain-containing protein [Phycisphaerae bacterium]|nr:glycoside hydrolase family 3 C-terminal domain-containing protein [Phycisphaerae bacterium]